MASITAPIKDPAALRRGDLVEVHKWDTVICIGRIEDRMTALCVLWVRDQRTGERKMFCTNEHLIRRFAATH